MRLLWLLGRILFTAIFAHSAYKQLLGFSGLVHQVRGYGVPFPEVAAALVFALLVVGTVLIVLGLYARFGALCYAVFLVLVTPMAHKYWGVDPSKAGMQEVQFLKNLSLFGACLVLMATGPGPLSLRRGR